jgi:hypothetical protein
LGGDSAAVYWSNRFNALVIILRRSEMKFLQQLFIVGFLLFMLAGCGKDNGDLTVSSASTATSATFTIQYSKSGVTNYAGLDCTIYATATHSDNSVSILENDSITFSSSGIKILTFDTLVPGDVVRLKAKVGDIVSSASVTISASSLTVSPTSLDISSLSTGVQSSDITISGGTAPYHVVSGSSNVTVSTNSTNSTFTVSKASTNTGSTTIYITDSSTSVKTGTISVSY